MVIRLLVVRELVLFPFFLRGFLRFNEASEKLGEFYWTIYRLFRGEFQAILGCYKLLTGECRNVEFLAIFRVPSHVPSHILSYSPL